jgi:hypothetical protein
MKTKAGLWGGLALALGAVAVACSSSNGSAPGGGDAGSDATTSPGDDSGAGDGSAPDASDGGGLADGRAPDAGPTCPPAAITATVASYDQTFGFKIPVVSVVPACSAADLVTYEDNFKNLFQWTDLVKNLPQACADCILTPSTAQGYGPYVTLDVAKKQGFSNPGACYAQVTAESGGTPQEAEACGKAMTYTEFCLLEACDCAQGGPDPKAVEACATKALAPGGACATFYAGHTSCKLTKAQETFCNSLKNGVAYLCGGAAPP